VLQAFRGTAGRIRLRIAQGEEIGQVLLQQHIPGRGRRFDLAGEIRDVRHVGDMLHTHAAIVEHARAQRKRIQAGGHSFIEQHIERLQQARSDGPLQLGDVEGDQVRQNRGGDRLRGAQEIEEPAFPVTCLEDGRHAHLPVLAGLERGKLLGQQRSGRLGRLRAVEFWRPPGQGEHRRSCCGGRGAICGPCCARRSRAGRRCLRGRHSCGSRSRRRYGGRRRIRRHSACAP